MAQFVLTTGRTIGGWLPVSVRRQARDRLVRWRHRGLRPSDVLLVSYPKSGSTWLRMLLAEALTGHEGDFDSIRSSVPPIGHHGAAQALLPGSGRLIRSHEILDPSYPISAQRVVYLLRDPRAVAVSFFHHSLRMGSYSGDLDSFCRDFVAGCIGDLGPWKCHVELALDRAEYQEGRVLLVRYEDLVADTEGQLLRIVAFLGVDVPLATVRQAVEHNAAARMREKEQQSTFLAGRGDPSETLVRAGAAPGWRKEMSPAAQAFIDDDMGELVIRAGYQM